MGQLDKKSMLCPGCRRLISSDEPSCPYCGLANPGSPIRKSLTRLSFRDGDSLIQFIIYVNAAIFILALVLKPSEMGMSLNPFTLLSPSSTSLMLLGATGTIPIDYYHRWWTILTASSLHGGILHIAFNMMALHQLGPFVTHEYGTARFVILYVVSGIAGFVLSYLVGIPFTLGASASVCGLIGAILYYGKSRGGYFGMAIYRQAMGWIIGLILFGLLLPGINNWAHGGGVAAGIAIGFALGYEDRVAETLLHRAIAAVCALVTAGAILFTVIQALFIRFF
ncbi:MAG TPA: rhomboid family intramembrane serine protease [Syntrophales bacterium]|nr:rhomboid family intramembrane serine protease [Syntrophales bacterium]